MTLAHATPLTDSEVEVITRFLEALNDTDKLCELMQYQETKRISGDPVSRQAFASYVGFVLSTSPASMHTVSYFFNQVYTVANESEIFAREDLPTPEQVTRILQLESHL